MHLGEDGRIARPKIRIKDLRKAFYVRKKRGFLQSKLEVATVALAGVSLDIKENEFISIVGPSGCGKTTMLKIIAGLVSATAGEVSIDGSPALEPREGSGMVFQHIGLLPWRTVESNVLLSIELKHHRQPLDTERERARMYLQLVGLGGFEGYYPHQLSGGMQQRVGMARALVIEPDVLLMDEPFGALDAQTRLVLQDELLAICDNYRATVVFVTHDIEEAIYLSDRVVVMSARPGVIKRVVDITLPRPRQAGDIRSSAGFADLRRLIWEDLRREQSEVLQP